MLTTKRSSENSYFSNDRSGGVELLERKVPDTYAQYVSADKVNVDEDFETAKERMQRNLDLIMNYDKVQEEVKVEDKVEEVAKVEEAPAEEEDIRPSSTTLQFGEENIAQMYNDINTAEKKEEQAHHLTTKNKVIIAIYSLVVAIVLALIIINTSVLASIRNDNALKTALLSAKAQQYVSLTSEIELASSDSHIIDLVENDYGMIRR